MPIVNGLTTGRHPWASAAAGDGLYLWFDAAMLGLALVLGTAAHKARGAGTAVRPRSRAASHALQPDVLKRA